MKTVVVAVTPSIVAQVDEHLGVKWKARCPICKDAGRKRVWQEYAKTRLAAERALNKHLKSHNVEQGSFL